jgi:ABC-type dipeptide/oligopeptide/nickel transport system permease subunit
MRARLVPRVRRRPALWVGGTLVGIFILLAILASLVHHGAYVAEPENPFQPPLWDHGGSLSHPLGTDALGRDIGARMLFGIRVSVEVAVASVVLAGIVGVAVGEIAGFLGGWIDDLVMRICDGLLAIPVILLAISVIGAAGSSLLTLILVLAGTQWMLFARVARGSTLVLRERQFIVAQQALGSRRRRIMVRHIVPHVLPTALVVATLNVPTVILLESGLDFLGLGVQPPTPSIGGMISDGLETITSHALIAVYPGIVLMLLVVAINLLGDGIGAAVSRGR